MPRLARIVLENIPHHIIQRGNRSQQVFFSDKDKYTYLKLLRENANKAHITFLAYCLMDNHVHLIAIPQQTSSLAQGIGETHRNYSRMVNQREGWTGYLWQGRFLSYPLDQCHLYAAIRYVERNPVEAGLVSNPADYIWSSAAAHIHGKEDLLLRNHTDYLNISNWDEYLDSPSKEETANIEAHIKTGRPMGDKKFITSAEQKTGRKLHKRKPGPKQKIYRTTN